MKTSWSFFYSQRRTNDLIESNTAILKDLLSPTADGGKKAAIFQALEQIGKMAANSDYTSEFAEVPQRSPADSWVDMPTKTLQTRQWKRGL